MWATPSYHPFLHPLAEKKVAKYPNHPVFFPIFHRIFHERNHPAVEPQFIPHPEHPRMPQPVAVGIRRRHVHGFKGPGPRGPRETVCLKMCGPILIFYWSYYINIQYIVCIYICIYIYIYIVCVYIYVIYIYVCV